MTVTVTRVGGRYRLGPSLGVGGMGRVWLARDEILQREVAIKEVALPAGLAEDEREELRLRTLREARAAARVNHPNVVQIYDVIPGEDQPWIVMEYVRARSLMEIITEYGPLPVDQVARIGIGMLSALEAANRAGVLHRDVKPSNVLIAHDGRVVLTDFGSAILDDTEGAITKTGVILGSPQYIAPERARTGMSTLESDLWSLGATLYTAAEGRSPFTRPTVLGTLIAVATERPDQIRRASALKPVLTGLLHRNPKARMTAFETDRRLRRIAGLELKTDRLVPAQRQPREPVRVQIDSLKSAAGPPVAGGVGATRQAPPGDLDDHTAVVLALPPMAPVLPNTPAPPDALPPSEAPDPPDATAPPNVIVPPNVTVPPKVTASPAALPPLLAAVRMRPSRWAVAAVAAVVLLTLGGVALAARAAHRTPGTPTSAATGPASGGSGANAGTGIAGGLPAPRPAPPQARPLPANLSWWYDQSGFIVPMPTGWKTVREGPQAMFFCEPNGPRTLRVRVWDQPDPDPVVAMTREEARANLGNNYHRIRIQALPDGQGIEWEYTFTDEMGNLHGLERGFVVGGHVYLIQWRVPVQTWQANVADYTAIINGFQPQRPPSRNQI